MQPDLRGKRVTVVGMARSGVAAARALHALGAQVTITDRKPVDQLRAQAAALGTAEIAVEAGGHPERIFTGADLIVLSPGVPKIPPVRAALDRGVKVIGELELGWLLADAPFVGITGTNGKSTVTTLVGLMLKKAGKRTLVAGNIGNALTEEVPLLQGQDWIVVELSSFQLEDIDTFRPRIAAVLNVTQDHLDRYATLEEYAAAKERIFRNQRKDDALVLNFEGWVVGGRLTPTDEGAESRYFPRDALPEPTLPKHVERIHDSARRTEVVFKVQDTPPGLEVLGFAR